MPYPAGGPTDVLGRMVGEYLGRDLKQSVVVENKGGAQGAIGAERVALRARRLHAVLHGVVVFVLNPLLYKKLSYDPDTEFRVLAVVTDMPVVMVVHPSVPAQDGRGIRRLRQGRIPASSISVRPAPAASGISPARCSS